MLSVIVIYIFIQLSIEHEVMILRERTIFSI